MIGSRRLAAGTLLVLLGTLSAPGAARAQRTTSPGSFALELAGASVGLLRGVSGGEAVGEVVTETTGGAFAGKRIGAVRFSDIELEIGAGMEPAVYAWIASAWEGKWNRTSGAVLLASYNLQVIRRQEFRDALIAETRLPALDAASKEPAFLRVRLAAEGVATSKGGGTLPSTLAAKTQKPWLASQFRLEIPGLDCTRIRKIDALTIGTKLQSDGRSIEPGPVSVSDLVVTFPELSAESWNEWTKSFLVDGMNGSDQEKNGVLILLGTDGQSEIARVNLFGLGISSLRYVAADAANQIRSVVATLYCERAALEWKGGAASVMNVRVFGR